MRSPSWWKCRGGEGPIGGMPVPANRPPSTSSAAFSSQGEIDGDPQSAIATSSRSTSFSF